MADRQIMMTGLLAVIALAGFARAAANAWIGNGDGKSWSDGANWSAGVPAAGDDVTVTTGTVLLTAATPELGSFTMSSGTLTFTNWTTALQATNILLSGGTVTLPAAYTVAQMSNRVWFVAVEDFTLGSNAVINAAGRGYRNLYGPGKGTNYQYNLHWKQGTGAGHGGTGGRANNVVAAVGAAYGDYKIPLMPGSGCGADEAGGYGFGGGAVLIQAGSAVTVNGEITVAGWPGTANGGTFAGGGSGGSVMIECHTFGGASTGKIGADGGNSSGTQSGAGAGGRIAVNYTSLAATCDVLFSAVGGANGWADNTAGAAVEFHNYLASWGTLYFPDWQMVRYGFSGQRLKGDVFVGNGDTTLNLTALALTNATLRLADKKARLNVTGDVAIDGNSSFHFYGTNLTVGGKVALAGGSRMALFSGQNLTGTNYGQLVSIADSLALAPLATLWLHSEPASGNSTLIVADKIEVAGGAAISAQSRGYRNSKGPGVGEALTNPHSGSGYGGTGGAPDYQMSRGNSYGSAVNPLEPGSGGGASMAGKYAYGGGLIRLEARQVIVDGNLNADGASTKVGGGGASGGAINIKCQQLGGDGGLLSVKGGDGNGGNLGGGGGGRMALRYSSLLTPHKLSFIASGGLSWPDTNHTTRGWAGSAQPGTLYLPGVGLLDNEMKDNRFRDVFIHLADGVDEWNVTGDLKISNTWFVVGAEGFKINVAGNATIDKNAAFGIGGLGELNVAGNLVATNGGALRLTAGGNAAAAPGEYGVLAEIGGKLVVGPASFVYLYSDSVNGGSPLLRLGGLEVAATGEINANARGYDQGVGLGKGVRNWTGSNTEGMGSGGGHGGRGGDTRYLWKASLSNRGIGGAANDSDWMPLWPGSGGYQGTGGSQAPLLTRPPTPTMGGGVARLDVTGPVIVDGKITANGANGTIIDFAAGGAGGTIFIRTTERRIQGANTSSISAAGGNARVNSGKYSSGGGGGGRIAFWLSAPLDKWPQIESGVFKRCVFENQLDDSFKGSISVAAGMGYDNWDTNDPGNPVAGEAEDGTVVVLRMLPQGGTVIIVE